MDILRSNLTHYSPIVALVVTICLVGLLAWVVALQRRSRRLEARLDEMFGDAGSDTMGRLLADYLTTVRSTASTVSRMKAEHDEVASVFPQAIRHVGLVRFSPFHDTGGDQSFALAFLDGRGDGVVVTALHSRSDSRLYAKPVEHGSSPYSLSPEEREAMDRALHKREVEAPVR
ncbi:MAG: DUF4446 family protein [Chloroflexota bacterium]